MNRSDSTPSDKQSTSPKTPEQTPEAETSPSDGLLETSPEKKELNLDFFYEGDYSWFYPN